MVYDQDNFSKSYSQMYEKEIRILKAKKALAVIKDFAKETDELDESKEKLPEMFHEEHAVDC